MSKIIAFIKSRPTEVWLGLWAAIVAVLAAFGIDVEAAATAAISAVVAWLTTFVASRDSNTLGPQ
jgi:hypothetical protein